MRQPEPNRHGSHQRGRTQVSSLITALAVVLFLLTMTGLLNGVPRVFLSCIVVFSVFFPPGYRHAAVLLACGATTSPPHLAGLGGC